MRVSQNTTYEAKAFAEYLLRIGNRTEPRAILTPLNSDVDDLNNQIMAKFPEEQQKYYSFDSQFPIRPAFALTINKAQEQMLSYIGLYLPNSDFSHGQLYVAMSRVREKSNLKVLVKN
ncbi:16715_t:CDS:2, partial [Gigaspora margarita]